MRKHTPWGATQDAVILAKGIISYSTAEHGGIWLSAERRAQLNYDKNFLKTSEWWEEDRDWAVPYVFFADDIRKHGKPYKFEKNLAYAKEIVKAYHPAFNA